MKGTSHIVRLCHASVIFVPDRSRGRRDMKTRQITARLPETVLGQIDQMAEQVGMGRGQVLRLLLARATEEGLPSGLADHAEALKVARGRLS